MIIKLRYMLEPFVIPPVQKLPFGKICEVKPISRKHLVLFNLKIKSIMRCEKKQPSNLGSSETTREAPLFKKSQFDFLFIFKTLSQTTK
jgi:hypothetical protein